MCMTPLTREQFDTFSANLNDCPDKLLVRCAPAEANTTVGPGPAASAAAAAAVAAARVAVAARPAAPAATRPRGSQGVV